MDKFDDTETERLYEITLEGGADEEIGTADGFGWFGRVGASILGEDAQGFVTRCQYDTEADAVDSFARLTTEALKWEAETGTWV